MFWPTSQPVESKQLAFPQISSRARERLLIAILFLGEVAPLAGVLVIAAAIRRTDDHSLVRDTISDLAAQDAVRPGLMQGGMIGFGLIMTVFGAAVATMVPVRLRLERLALPSFGVALALAGLFQDHSEAPGAAKNWEGFLHNTFGIAAIACLIVAMGSVALASRAHVPWQSTRTVTILAMGTVGLSGALFSAGPITDRGAVELVLAAAAIIWILAIARCALAAARTSHG